MSDWTALSAVIDALMTLATFTMAYMTWHAVQIQRDQLIQAHSPRSFVTSKFAGFGVLPTLRLRNKGLGPAYDVVVLVVVQNIWTGAQMDALRAEYWPTSPETQRDFNAPDSHCIPADLLGSIVEQERAQTGFSVVVTAYYGDRLFQEHASVVQSGSTGSRRATLGGWNIQRGTFSGRGWPSTAKGVGLPDDSFLGCSVCPHIAQNQGLSFTLRCGTYPVIL